MRAALDTLVASDLPVLAKAFFVTLFLVAGAMALGAFSALVAYLLRALPLHATNDAAQEPDAENRENPGVEPSRGRSSADYFDSGDAA